MIQSFEEEEKENVVSAEFTDYLKGGITFNELMELLLEGLDEVDE